MKHSRLFGKKTLAAATAALLGLSAPYGAVAVGAATYNETAKESLAEIAAAIGTGYAAYVEELANATTESAAAEYIITPGSDLSTLVSAFLGEGLDLEWLDNITITQNQALDETGMTAVFDVSLNGTHILTLNYLMDGATGNMYMNVPELNDGYIMVNAAALEDDYTEVSTASLEEVLELINSAAEKLPSGDSIESLINKYGEIIIENAADQGESSETLTVGSVSADVTVLEGRITEGALYTAAQQLVETAKADEELKAVLDSIASISPELDGLYDSFMEGITELEEDLNDTDPEDADDSNYISEKVYVAEDGTAAGRRFSIFDNGDEEVYCELLTITDGSATGFALTVGEEGYVIFEITGNGDGAGSGSYAVIVDEAELATVDLANVAVSEEAGSGSVVITVSDAVAEMDDELGMLAGAALSVDFEAEGESSAFTLGVEYAGMGLLNLAISAAPSDPIPMISVDSLGTIYDVENDTDMETYTSTIDIMGLLTSLGNAGAGDFINGLMSGSF